MAKPFYEMSDTELLAWSNAFSQNVTATPAAFGVTAAQASAYAALNTAFETALSVWRDQSTKTPVASANKKAARVALLDGAKYLVSTINSNPDTTDAHRDQSGIKARKRPTPIPAPSQSPMVDVISVSGRTVTIGLHSDGRRGRPAGAAGASVFTAASDEAPADTAGWTFEGLITKTKLDISFEQSTAANTVWVTAFWYSARGQSGAACQPVSINLPASNPLPQGKAMKIAARVRFQRGRARLRSARRLSSSHRVESSCPTHSYYLGIPLPSRCRRPSRVADTASAAQPGTRYSGGNPRIWSSNRVLSRNRSVPVRLLTWHTM